MPLLKGKNALITGGSAGIGKAIAALFVEAGANVWIVGTNRDKALLALEELQGIRKDEEQKISLYVANVADFKQVEEMAEKALEELQSLDILVNNAGITRDHLFMKMTEEDWDEVIQVNLKSVFNCCKAFVRPMMKARSGCLINICSVIGLVGNAGQANYAASKAGMIGLTKSLAKELAKRNIRANCIAPGYIETSMTDVLSVEIKQEILNKIPLGRIGHPSEIAKAALFLALSDYITGQTLVVDGGMVI